MTCCCDAATTGPPRAFATVLTTGDDERCREFFKTLPPLLPLLLEPWDRLCVNDNVLAVPLAALVAEDSFRMAAASGPRFFKTDAFGIFGSLYCFLGASMRP